MSDDRDPGAMPPPPPRRDDAPPPPPAGPSGGTPSTPSWGGGPGTGSSWNAPADSGYSPQAAGGWGTEQPGGPQPAGLGLRIVAYIIDAILVGIVFGIVMVLLGALFVAGEALAPQDLMTGGTFGFSYLSSVLGALFTITYFTLLEANGGQTLGKRLLNIRAVRADGRRIEMADAFKRRLPFVIGSVVPVLGGLISLGLIIAILVTAAQDKPYNRGLHDKWADTMVVRT